MATSAVPVGLAYDLALLESHRATFARCACGCRFRWPADAGRHVIHVLTGEIEEVFELASCPQCGSSRQRNLAEPYPRAYFDDAHPGESSQMVDENGRDLEMCAELLECVASHLGDPNDPLSQQETFESVLYQSKELLIDLMQRLKEGVRIGESDAKDAAQQVAVLEDILRPLARGSLLRPDELVLLYLRMAKVLRALGPTMPPKSGLVAGSRAPDSTKRMARLDSEEITQLSVSTGRQQK